MLPSKLGTSLKVIVVKSAPEEDLKGETYYYRCLQSIPRLQPLFPMYYGSSPGKLKIEYVNSVPLTHVFNLMQFGALHMNAVFSALDTLHTCKDVVPTMTPTQIRESYMSKLAKRVAGPEFASLKGVVGVYTQLASRLKHYTPTCVGVIHGDPWFANMLWTYDGRIKCVDMRGLIGNTLTLNGDPNYDYAKVYQSLLGFDEIVFGLNPVHSRYRTETISLFLGHLKLRGVNVEDVFLITMCNMVGSIPFHLHRAELWEFIQALLRT
jgi:hypothetical protein